MKNTAGNLMQRMKNDGLTSSVRILTVNEIGDSFWQVDFVVDYFLPSSYKPKTVKYRATVRIQYQRRRVQFKERLKNPVGFKVVQYGIKTIKE